MNDNVLYYDLKMAMKHYDDIEDEIFDAKTKLAYLKVVFGDNYTNKELEDKISNLKIERDEAYNKYLIASAAFRTCLKNN